MKCYVDAFKAIVMKDSASNVLVQACEKNQYLHLVELRWPLSKDISLQLLFNPLHLMSNYW